MFGLLSLESSARTGDNEFDDSMITTINARETNEVAHACTLSSVWVKVGEERNRAWHLGGSTAVDIECRDLNPFLSHVASCAMRLIPRRESVARRVVCVLHQANR